LAKSRLGWLRDGEHAALVRRGLRGLEKESLRVDRDGRLSRRPHPVRLGSALTHPYLTTDYSEALVEFVTPAYPSNWETLQFLCDAHSFVLESMDDELLWAQSMPCLMGPDREIPIAEYGSSNLGRMKTVYRSGLGFRYGRAMQAISGLHFNYSLPRAFWEPYREHVGSDEDLQDFISAQYMALVRNYRRRAWLVIYLFGASPALCKSFSSERQSLLEEFNSNTWYAPFGTSLRMSDIGYRNKSQAGIQISANALSEYISGLVTAVTTSSPQYEAIGVRVDGAYRQLNTSVLQIENEYYSSIRPKPRADSQDRPTVALREGGVEYVEVRTLDLNVMDPAGVNQNQLRFLEAMLIACLITESPPIDASEQAEIDGRDLLVAREGRRPGLSLPHGGREVALRELALELLGPIKEVAAALDSDGEGYVEAVEAQEAAVLNPELTPSAQFLSQMREKQMGFFDFALELSRGHCEYFASLKLTAEKRALFDRLVTDSLEEHARAERQSEPPFDEYLREYFRRV